MLVLSRKVGESVYIGDSVTVTVNAINGSKIKLAIDAPRYVKVLRAEVAQQEKERNA